MLLPLDKVSRQIPRRLSDNLHPNVVPNEKISIGGHHHGPVTHQGILAVLVRSYMSSSGLLSVWKSETAGLL